MTSKTEGGLHILGDMENCVCRALHSVKALKLVIDEVTFNPAGRNVPMSHEERELLAYAMYEAIDRAQEAKDEYYERVFPAAVKAGRS